MEIVRRIHNPRNQVCACDPDCWCNRTALGRAVKWWFNGRLVGLQHKSRAIEKFTSAYEAAEWKRERDRQGES